VGYARRILEHSLEVPNQLHFSACGQEITIGEEHENTPPVTNTGGIQPTGLHSVDHYGIVAISVSIWYCRHARDELINRNTSRPRRRCRTLATCGVHYHVSDDRSNESTTRDTPPIAGTNDLLDGAIEMPNTLICRVICQDSFKSLSI